jgi:hypothetical protein
MRSRIADLVVLSLIFCFTHVPGFSQAEAEQMLAQYPPPGIRTAGVIQAAIARILRTVGLPAFIAAISGKIHAQAWHAGGPSPPIAAQAA